MWIGEYECVSFFACIIPIMKMSGGDFPFLMHVLYHRHSKISRDQA
jgi:hypothetical protein